MEVDAPTSPAAVPAPGLPEEGTEMSDVEDTRATQSDPGRLQTKKESSSSGSSSDSELDTTARPAPALPAAGADAAPSLPAEGTPTASSLDGSWIEVTTAELLGVAPDAAPSLPAQGTEAPPATEPPAAETAAETPVAAETPAAAPDAGTLEGAMSGGDALSIATEESWEIGSVASTAQSWVLPDSSG